MNNKNTSFDPDKDFTRAERQHIKRVGRPHGDTDPVVFAQILIADLAEKRDWSPKISSRMNAYLYDGYVYCAFKGMPTDDDYRRFGFEQIVFSE